MTLRSSLAVTAALLLSLAPTLADAKLTPAAGDNTAKFNASGPGGLAIVGTTGGVTATEEGLNIVVTVPLKDIDTGIALRNKHAREKYLEVDKYPAAVLTVPRASLKFPAPGASVNASAVGTMLIHGTTQPVTFQYSARNEGGTYRVAASAPVNINDFGIRVPVYLGITVKPNLTVEVHFAAKD